MKKNSENNLEISKRIHIFIKLLNFQFVDV